MRVLTADCSVWSGCTGPQGGCPVAHVSHYGTLGGWPPSPRGQGDKCEDLKVGYVGKYVKNKQCYARTSQPYKHRAHVF